MLTWCENHYEEQLTLLKTLAAIPAPSHQEEQRAAFIKNWLEEQGAEKVSVDEAGNVISTRQANDQGVRVATKEEDSLLYANDSYAWNKLYKKDFDTNQIFAMDTEMENFVSDSTQAIAIYEYDQETLEIIRVNNAYYELMGYDDRYMRANNLLEVL